MTITTHHGDNLDILPTLAPASVQALISSPPFYGLRRYEIPPSAWPAVSYAPIAGLPPLDIPAMTCQLGAESTPEAYTAHIVHTMRLARGALRGDGAVMLNFGDSYAGSWGNYAPGGIKGEQRPRTEDGKRWERPAYGDTTTLPATARVSHLAEKNLIGIPWRVALALQADGWILRNDAIWHKPNCMPESVKDRFTRAHEYCFVFAKSPRYFWDDAGEEAIKGASGSTFTDGKTGMNGMGRVSQQPRVETATRNRRTVLTIPTAATTLAGRCPACRGVGYDNRAAAADPAVARLAVVPHRQARALVRELRNRYPCHACGATGRAGEEHYAMWPEALVEIFVRAMSSHRACEICGSAWRRVVEQTGIIQDRHSATNGLAYIGGTHTERTTRRHMETTGHAPTCDCDATGSARCMILDPYAGSGTTGVVAERLGRDSVLIDLGYQAARSKRTDGVQVEMEAYQ